MGVGLRRRRFPPGGLEQSSLSGLNPIKPAPASESNKGCYWVWTIGEIKPSSAYFNEQNLMTGEILLFSVICVFVCVIIFPGNASHDFGCNLTVTGNVCTRLCLCECLHLLMCASGN